MHRGEIEAVRAVFGAASLVRFNRTVAPCGDATKGDAHGPESAAIALISPNGRQKPCSQPWEQPTPYSPDRKPCATHRGSSVRSFGVPTYVHLQEKPLRAAGHSSAREEQALPATNLATVMPLT